MLAAGGVLVAAPSGTADPGVAAAPIVHRLRVHDKAAVNYAYWTRYADLRRVRTGFTGSVLGCLPGTDSPASLTATMRAINLMRGLNHLDPVTFSARLNDRSMLTALMIAANRTLSHYPDQSWLCYTRAGARNAADSNLAYRYPRINPVGVVRMYMTDDGAENRSVGHRRWLLYPFTTTMGSGTTHTTNAMHVRGDTTRTRHNPAWVSWPSRGWFPAPLVPGRRWSLSSGHRHADFSHARVRVHRNGHRVRVSRIAAGDRYGMPTVVWHLHERIHPRATYHVVVRNVRIHGRSVDRSYWVELFRPRR